MNKSKKLPKVVAGSVKKAIKGFTSLSVRKKFILFTSIFAFVFLVLPNIGGAMKVLGFIEPDFVKSTSGALYETNPQAFPYFLFKVGSGENQSETVSSFVVSGKTISVKQVTQKLTESESSETIVEDLSGLGLDTSPLEKIESELASISAELAEVEQKVSETSFDTMNVLGASDQRLFGPYEQIVFRRNDGNGEYSYHREGNKILETLSFVNIPESLGLQISMPEGVRMVVSTNGVANFVSDGTTIASLKLLLSIENGPFGEFVVDGGNYSDLTTITIPLGDMEGKSGSIRLVYSAEGQNITEIEKLGISQEYVQFHTLVSPDPLYLTQFKGETVFYSELGSSVSLLRGQAMTTLFSFPEQITGMSCTDFVCFASSKSGLYKFNPEEALNLVNSDTLSSFTPQLIEVGDGNTGGLTSSESLFIRTSNVSPEGAVYEFGEDNLQGVKILSDLSSPSIIASNLNSTRIALWSDGKLFIGSSTGEFESVDLEYTPISIAVDESGLVYLALAPGSGQKAMVVRLNPESGDSHVLSKFVGDITSLDVNSSELAIGVSVSSLTGAIVKLPLDSSKWIPVVSQLPSL